MSGEFSLLMDLVSDPRDNRVIEFAKLEVESVIIPLPLHPIVLLPLFTTLKVSTHLTKLSFFRGVPNRGKINTLEPY